MGYKLDPPDDVWVDYALPWIEGRCIPEKRLKHDGDRWTIQYRYPKPDTDESDDFTELMREESYEWTASGEKSGETYSGT